VQFDDLSGLPGERRELMLALGHTAYRKKAERLEGTSDVFDATARDEQVHVAREPSAGRHETARVQCAALQERDRDSGLRGGFSSLARHSRKPLCRHLRNTVRGKKGPSRRAEVGAQGRKGRARCDPTSQVETSREVQGSRRIYWWVND
jgi:hypothetical protein